MKKICLTMGALWAICLLPLAAQHRTLEEYLNDTNRLSKRDSIRLAKAMEKELKADSVPQDTVIDKYSRFIDIASPLDDSESFCKSISILAFEKAIDEKVETFLLCNNTDYTIGDIVLRIVYKTPNDSLMISYRDVVLTEEVLPRSTKRFSIESFDPYKRYFYIDNPLKQDESGLPFSIRIELQGYKVAVTPYNYSTIIEEVQ